MGVAATDKSKNGTERYTKTTDLAKAKAWIKEDNAIAMKNLFDSGIDGSTGANLGDAEIEQQAIEKYFITQEEFDAEVRDFYNIDEYAAESKKKAKELKAKRAKAKKKVTRTSYTSFARIALEFVAKPLAASQKFNEVQLLFYPMNAFSTFARDDDVGSWPVACNRFERQFKAALKKTPHMTIQAFVNFMNRNFFSNIASDIYGFRSIYTRDPETARATLRSKYKNRAKYKRKLPDMKKAVFKKAYGPKSEQKFIKPVIQMYLEAVPGRDNQNGGESATILRIHFFDKTATSYRCFSDLWESLRSGTTSLVNTMSVDPEYTVKRPNSKAPQASTRSGHGEQWAQQLALLTEMDVLEGVTENGDTVDLKELFTEFDQKTGETTDDETKEEANALLNAPYVRIKGGPAGLRYLYHRNMPSIKYGSTFSAVKKANLATQQDNRMATIHMQRLRRNRSQGKGDNDGLPLRTFPATLTMEMYGCPFMNFGQQYFIDFGTGTTVDDIYAVNGVTHKFTPGDFTTTLKMIPLMKFGQYQSLLGNLSKMANEIRSLVPPGADEPEPSVKKGTSKPKEPDPRTTPIILPGIGQVNTVMVNPDDLFE